MKLEINTDKVAQCLGCFNANERVLNAATEIAYYFSEINKDFDSKWFMQIVKDNIGCIIVGCAHFDRDSYICKYEGDCPYNPLCLAITEQKCR